MSSNYYILDGHQAVESNLWNWAQFMEKRGGERVVGKHEVGEALVSTIFLGRNHNFGGYGPPLIFETLVFGGPLDGEGERYSTWEEAEAGHAAWVEKLTAACPSHV